jgi:hypothetical protein
VELYIDGVRQNIIAVEGESKSILMGGLYKSVGIFKGVIAIDDIALTIGGTDSKLADDYFDGSIAEVRVWGIGRTQNEIRSTLEIRIDQPQNQPDLYGYWRLDETTEVNGEIRIRDRSKSNNHGTIQGATWFPIATRASIDIAQNPLADLIQQVLDRDLLPNFWSAGAIVSDPRFQPEEPITSDQYKQALTKIFELDPPVLPNSDIVVVPSQAKPDIQVNSVRRDAAIAHLVQGLGFKGSSAEANHKLLIETYADADNISKDYEEAIATATSQHMIVTPLKQAEQPM